MWLCHWGRMPSFVYRHSIWHCLYISGPKRPHSDLSRTCRGDVNCAPELWIFAGPVVAVNGSSSDRRSSQWWNRTFFWLMNYWWSSSRLLQYYIILGVFSWESSSNTWVLFYLLGKWCVMLSWCFRCKIRWKRIKVPQRYFGSYTKGWATPCKTLWYV